jgi:hypothetical protein
MNKKLVVVMIIVVLISGINGFCGSKKADAASFFITVNTFAQALADEIGIQYQAGSAGAVESLRNVGIIKDGDFSDFNKNLNRGDMLILLNRADEYVNKETVEEWLVSTVIEKRIYDINKVVISKREDIAKGYIKGFMKGYSRGYYITNRNLKLKNSVTKAGALEAIKMIKKSSLRAKISPDGQLIRTTKLPKNARDYDYILASYPNAFYEKKFEYMFSNQYKEGRRQPRYEIVPADMRASIFRTWNEEWSFSIEMDKYLYEWQKKAETYLDYIFNVDYRTVDNDWVEGLASCYVSSNIDYVDSIKKYYIKYMKANKVIVESKIIAVEPSALYFDSCYCMRAYVKYRITASDINTEQYQLLYSQYPYLDNLESGVWREGIFDIRFGTNNGYQGDGADFAISSRTYFVDARNVPID